ncbi:hypothetical protein [Streptomyces griseus]|uniref:hypothetical protein n=1 Tax=Streptomyces griseus TaxID=1911 RepID=UPI000997A232|nr:hypothetical protein [Streptomyces griseus]
MLIALTALLAQFAVILTHRRVNKVRTRPEPPVLYTMLCLFGIAVGWLSIGRPEITWSTSGASPFRLTAVSPSRAVSARPEP